MASERAGPRGLSRADEVRLPPPVRYPGLNPWTGPFILRPWFDRMALPLLLRFFFPLSRAWAAAARHGAARHGAARHGAARHGAAGHGAVGDFLRDAYGPEGKPPAPGRQAAKFVATVAARQRAYEAAERAWRALYFGPEGGGPAPSPEAPSPEVLVEAQTARRDAAQRFMAARAAGLPLHVARGFPPLRFEIAPPAQVEAAHGARLRDPEAAFPPPEPPAVAASHRVPSAQGQDHWLRFAAPTLGDTAWARVTEPEPEPESGAAGARGKWPSLIYLHGIGMETELWSTMIDSSLPLVRNGVRVIRPEGPWHGRRRPEGWYGGEIAMGRGPLGFIELFEAWVAEVAALIAWARQTSDGPVAVGGVSLGALTSQMVAVASRSWPAALRPDALLLVATSGDVLEVVEAGSLSGGLRVPPRLRAAGWSPEAVARWAPLLQPVGPPGLEPEKIVMVLGRADDLVPYGPGLALARTWGVPPENLFERPQGHFSVSLGLELAPAPLQRLAALLGAG